MPKNRIIKVKATVRNGRPVKAHTRVLKTKPMSAKSEARYNAKFPPADGSGRDYKKEFKYFDSNAKKKSKK
jgi:hypothetical protein